MTVVRRAEVGGALSPQPDKGADAADSQKRGFPLSPRRAHYRILRHAVTIESDSDGLLDIFDRDYALFRTDGPQPVSGLVFSVRLAPAGDCCLEVRDAAPEHRTIRCRRSLGEGASAEAAYRALLRELFAALEGFVILHAGVVASDTGAVLLAGPPGVGKTTLVLELAKAGMTFFSDDFCPIDRTDGLVHPYPRSAWVVGPQGTRGPKVRPGKRLLPSREYLPSPASARPCRPCLVILLDPGKGTDPVCTLRLGVAPEGRESLARDLESVGPELRVELPPGSEAGLRVGYPSGRGLTPKVRRILARHEDSIRDVFRDDAVRPEFDRAPALTALATHEAAFSLLGDLKTPDCGRSGARGWSLSPTAFLMELTALLGDAACHRMTVGRLGEMRDLILGLAGRPAGPRSRP
jgi:hypothetical protein